MERTTGIEPASSAWKAEVLAVELRPRMWGASLATVDACRPGSSTAVGRRRPTTVAAVARRFGVMAASAVVLLVLAWPAVAPRELDSLPISNYPMFAHPRGRVTNFDVVVLVDRDGVERPLDLRTVGGTDQPVQAAMTVRQAVGRGEAAELVHGDRRPGRRTGHRSGAPGQLRRSGVVLRRQGTDRTDGPRRVRGGRSVTASPATSPSRWFARGAAAPNVDRADGHLRVRLTVADRPIPLPPGRRRPARTPLRAGRCARCCSSSHLRPRRSSRSGSSRSSRASPRSPGAPEMVGADGCGRDVLPRDVHQLLRSGVPHRAPPDAAPPGARRWSPRRAAGAVRTARRADGRST